MASLSSSLLDALVECAQTGQLTKAAKNLHITQSALSQRIATLESTLEIRVLTRSRNGVALTQAGQTLLRYCLARNALEEEALKELRGGVSGKFTGNIRVGGFSSVMCSVVMKALANFVAAHPEVGVSMRSAELWQLPELLKRNEFDFVITNNEITQPGFKCTFLENELNVLVRKKGYKGPNVYLDHDEHDQTTFEFFRSIKTKPTSQHVQHVQHVQLVKRRYLGDIFALCEGVSLGYGMAVLPKHLIRGRSDFEVVEAGRVLALPVYAHYNESLQSLPFFREILTALKAGFRQHLKEKT